MICLRQQEVEKSNTVLFFSNCEVLNCINLRVFFKIIIIFPYAADNLTEGCINPYVDIWVMCFYSLEKNFVLFLIKQFCWIACRLVSSQILNKKALG